MWVTNSNQRGYYKSTKFKRFVMLFCYRDYPALHIVSMCNALTINIAPV